MKCQLSSRGNKALFIQRPEYEHQQALSQASALILRDDSAHQKTSGSVPRLHPNISNTGSGQSSDPTTRGTGKSSEEPHRSTRCSVPRINYILHSKRAQWELWYQASFPFLLGKQSYPPLRSPPPHQQQEPEKSIYPHKSLKDLCISQAIVTGRKNPTVQRGGAFSGESPASPSTPSHRGNLLMFHKRAGISLVSRRKKVVEVARAVPEPPMQSKRCWEGLLTFPRPQTHLGDHQSPLDPSFPVRLHKQLYLELF